jgi:hypothetical protein
MAVIHRTVPDGHSLDIAAISSGRRQASSTGHRDHPRGSLGNVAVIEGDRRRRVRRGFSGQPGSVHRQHRLPAYRKAFDTGDLGAMSWILNGYSLVFAAFLNPAGRLGDRYGLRQVFLSGLAVFTLGSAACGLSASFGVLVARPASFRHSAPRC